MQYESVNPLNGEVLRTFDEHTDQEMERLLATADQAFRQVWVNVGAQRTDLRIVRLWGGHPSPAAQEPASTCKLVGRVGHEPAI